MVARSSGGTREVAPSRTRPRRGGTGTGSPPTGLPGHAHVAVSDLCVRKRRTGGHPAGDIPGFAGGGPPDARNTRTQVGDRDSGRARPPLDAACRDVPGAGQGRHRRRPSTRAVREPQLDRPVKHRQHLLGRDLRGRQEPRAEAGGGDYGSSTPFMQPADEMRQPLQKPYIQLLAATCCT